MAADRARDEVDRLRSLLVGAGVDVEHRVDDATSQRDFEILARILSAPDTHQRVRRQPRPFPRPVRRRLITMAGAACAATAVVVVAVLTGQSSQAPAAAEPAVLHFSKLGVAPALAGATNSARGALESLATTAAQQPDDHGTGTQQITSYAWYLTVSGDATGNVAVAVAPTFSTFTLRPDGSATNHETRSAALDSDGRLIKAGAYPAGGHESTDEFPAGTLDPNAAADLPRDPTELRSTWLTQQSGSGCDASRPARAACLYYALVDLHAHYVVSPDLDAATWSALADEDFLDLGTTTDRLGRKSVAVAVPPVPGSDAQLLVLLVDPRTGALNGWEQVAQSVGQKALPAPAVTSFQAYREASWSNP
jgi:hypothetical protein